MKKSDLIFKPVVYLVLLIYIPLSQTVLAMGSKIIAAAVPEDHFFELWAKTAKSTFKAAYLFERLSLTQAVQEIKESNYAIIFTLVGLFAIWDLHHANDSSATPWKSGTRQLGPALHD